MNTENMRINIVLPEDILIKIIKYLDTKHLQLLPILSKSWKLIIYTNPIIFNEVRFGIKLQI